MLTNNLTMTGTTLTAVDTAALRYLQTNYDIGFQVYNERVGYNNYYLLADVLSDLNYLTKLIASLEQDKQLAIVDVELQLDDQIYIQSDPELVIEDKSFYLDGLDRVKRYVESWSYQQDQLLQQYEISFVLIVEWLTN